MPKAPDIAEFMAALDHPCKADIETLRALILAASPQISEGVKWNSLSFFCRDWFGTFHLRAKDGVQIILHRGAKAREAMAPVEDPDGLLHWLDANRATVVFTGADDIKAQSGAFTALIRAWITQL